MGALDHLGCLRPRGGINSSSQPVRRISDIGNFEGSCLRV